MGETKQQMTTDEMCDVIQRGSDEIDRLRKLVAEMLEALEIQICPLCEHTFAEHTDKYGCGHDRGDGYRSGGEILEALGPCGCKGGMLPDIQAGIAAIRKAKGEL